MGIVTDTGTRFDDPCLAQRIGSSESTWNRYAPTRLPNVRSETDSLLFVGRRASYRLCELPGTSGCCMVCSITTAITQVIVAENDAVLLDAHTHTHTLSAVLQCVLRLLRPEELQHGSSADNSDQPRILRWANGPFGTSMLCLSLQNWANSTPRTFSTWAMRRWTTVGRILSLCNKMYVAIYIRQAKSNMRCKR